MFKQSHSPWCLSLLLVAIVAANAAASALAVGPSEVPRTQPQVNVKTSTGAPAPKNAVDQPGQLNAGPNAAVDSMAANMASNPAAKPSDRQGATTESAQVSADDSVDAAPQRPDANPGETMRTPARALFARSQNLDVTQPVSVSQLLVLDRTIEVGTQLKIMAFSALGSWYQTTDPDGANYVALTYPATGDWTAILPDSDHGLQRRLIFELTRGAFEAGQILEVRYSRLQTDKTLAAPLSLPIAIRLPSGGSWQILPGEQRSFMPGPATALRINVEQQVQVNQIFDLSIQPIDAFGNTTTAEIESFDLLLNNRLLKEVNLKNSNYVAAGLTLNTLGRHQFSARSPAGGLQSKATTVWALAEPPAQLIWTDFSEHSLEALIATLPSAAQYPQISPSRLLNTPFEPQSTSAALPMAQALSPQLMPELTGPGNPIGDNRAKASTDLTERSPLANFEETALIAIEPQFVAPENTLTERHTATEDIAVDIPQYTASVTSKAADTPMQPSNSSSKPSKNGLSAVIQPIEAGGQFMTLIVGDTSLRIAQPELTTDRRGRQVALVEQLSGPSGHQWLSHYFATFGQRFGITSRKTSFQPRAHQQGPQTAIVVRPGQTWLEALAMGQTFVTSGTKAGLSFSVNGAQFGRAPHQAQRTAEIAVTTIERPLWARIFRNGELIEQLPFYAADDRATLIEGRGPPEPGQLFLYLESDSKPFAEGITFPRNGREWLGQLRLQDLIITASQADHLAGLLGHQIAQRPDQQQLDFLTWTHGNGALIQLDLMQTQKPSTQSTLRRDPAIDPESQALEAPSETQPSPAVTLELAEGYEDLTYFDVNRPPAATPSFTEQFDLEALRGQGIRRTLRVEGYRDQISLWYADVPPDSAVESVPPTHQITYLDRMGGRPGDYYTCQVLLRDGTSLYSSPVFVGGFDPKQGLTP